MTTAVPSDQSVTVRYWAGARAAAGVASDLVSGATVEDVVAAAVSLHPALRPVAAWRSNGTGGSTSSSSIDLRTWSPA